MKNKFRRILDCLLILEDAIVVARISNYSDIDSIIKTREYIMQTKNITQEDIAEYVRQLSMLD